MPQRLARSDPSGRIIVAPSLWRTASHILAAISRITHNPQQSRLELGAASQRLIPNGRTIWIADAHRDDGKRFVVHADEKLTAFLELESATREHAARPSATTLYSMRAVEVVRPVRSQ